MIYLHIWNERLVLNNMEMRACECGKWLPPLCMGFVDNVVAGMRCRKYICPKCCNKTSAEKLTGIPLYTAEEFLKLIRKVV